MLLRSSAAILIGTIITTTPLATSAFFVGFVVFFVIEASVKTT